ncbi:DUF4132 domain-containing protein [Dactylosporangium sp. McL0621]|uniref:DUF4132 domain-containing protein n=1 Tax=Dactylosporangium sp. McL0621 TaxID=3415678 RepID=UPI003CEC6F6E
MRKFVLPDEASWTLPEAWRDGLRPRRSGLTVPGQEVSADAVDELRTWLTDPDVVKTMQRVRERTVIFDPELLAAGEGHLDSWRAPGGPGDEPDPRAAAVAALLVGARIHEMGRRLVHAWVHQFGLEFAVRATGEMSRLVADGALWVIDPAPEKNYERLWRGDDLQDLTRVARALRALLTAAPDDEYERACEILAGYRTSPVGRILTSYLVPTQIAWVDEDCAATAAGWPGAPDRGEDFSWGDHRNLSGILVAAASTIEHLNQLRGNINDSLLGYKDRGVVGTILDGIGPDAAIAVLGDPFYRGVFRLHDDRWSHRERLNADAVQLLAEVPTDDAFRLMLRETLEGSRRRPGLVLKTKALTRFPVRTLRVLTELEAEREGPLYTAVLGLHVLADPRLLPAVADRLPAPARARAEQIVAGGGAGIGAAWATVLDAYDKSWKKDELDSSDEVKRAITALASIPTEEALGLVVDRVERKYFRPALLTAAKRDPRLALRVLAARATDEAVAELLRNHVLAYPQAVADTLPSLDGDPRARVEAIIGPVEQSPAADHSAATPPVLAGPPRRADGKPMRVPDLPEWLVLPTLPAVRTTGGDSLASDAVRNLCALLAVSKIAEPHPEISEVRTACEPGSLAAFAWAVFEQWQAAQYPAKSNLAMVALAVLGDDSTVPPLVALFPAWATSSMRVRTGMDVLAAIGTDLGLTQLGRLARKAKTAGFRRFAEERLNDVAAARRVRPEELADRIVPDLGLDADGRVVLDYGPRRFTVGFDEQFQPAITDQKGARLARLPRPAAADDAELAPAAQRRFTELKKDVKTIAGERTRALEEAMGSGRRWTGANFQRFFVEHPLHWQVTRRLLWAAFDEQGRAVTAFRAAEDRTFADLDDKTWTLDPAATIGVAHPWHFAADRAAWAEIFADYVIIQPFPQVGRELFEITDLDLDAAVGREVEGRKLYALTARGWRFGDGHSSLLRDWPGDVTIELGFGPGYHWQEPDAPQHLNHIRGDITALDPAGVSEVIRDVRWLAE